MTYINYTTPEDFRSPFTPVLGFSDETRDKVNDYIQNRVKGFFSVLGIDFGLTEFISISNTITEKEFKKSSTELANGYFYKIIFTEIEKLHDGSIGEKIKYCITFDKDITPYTKDNFNFGFIKIANRPVLFYILFDLQELIRISKIEGT